MAEPFGKPTKQDIEKARELYSDPILYWATNVAVASLQDLKIDFSYSCAREWIRLTRLMILNYPVVLLQGKFKEIIYDVANEQWTDFEVPSTKKEVVVSIDPSATELKDRIKITDIARKYGVKVRGKMAICPFHDDKDPSLSLSDEKGLFNCFGCNSSGDLITFVRMLEDLK